MAQTGYFLSDDGKTFSATNDSGTTAIYAGDLVYTGTVNDKFTGTAARARSGYAIGDVLVKSVGCATTGYKTIVGIACEDIPADGVGAVSTRGLWLHAVNSNVEAGNVLMGATTTTNKVMTIADNTTTVTAAIADRYRYVIGKAITGGSADGKYILWKLNI